MASLCGVWTGVALACAATVGTNVGVNLQKKSHISRAETSLADTPITRYWTEPVWVVGMMLVVLSSLLDLIALGFAAQIIVASVGALSPVFNIFASHFMLGEAISELEIFCTLMMVLGCSMIVASADTGQEFRSPSQLLAMYSHPAFILFCFVVGAAMGLLFWQVRNEKKLRRQGLFSAYSGRRHRFCLASLSGLIGSWNVLFAKVLSELILFAVRTGDFSVFFVNALVFLHLVILLLMVVSQFKFLNSALRLFSSSYVVPVFQLFWLLGSISSGLFFFEEYSILTGVRLAWFGVGCSLTVGGVLLLSTRQPHVPLLMLEQTASAEFMLANSDFESAA